jgi:hypothetical protein
MVETLISSYLSRLDRFGKNGKIHSTFANSFNIIVNNRLINFNTAAEFSFEFWCSDFTGEVPKNATILSTRQFRNYYE